MIRKNKLPPKSIYSRRINNSCATIKLYIFKNGPEKNTVGLKRALKKYLRFHVPFQTGMIAFIYDYPENPQHDYSIEDAREKKTNEKSNKISFFCFTRCQCNEIVCDCHTSERFS